jgi:hypothetical protein
VGISNDTLNFIQDSIKDFPGKRMLELGNQRIHNDVDTPFKTGKEYFTALGYEHVSIDLNGKDGALKLDLTKPIIHIGKFDIITNFGVSGWTNNEMECLNNIHYLCRIGGLMIHTLPEIGSNWSGTKHQKLFVYCLAVMNKYKILKSGIINGVHGDLIAAVLIQQEYAEFVWPADL